MKRFMVLVSTILCIYLLTGCGNKTVSCEGDITSSGVTANVKVTGDFSKDELNKEKIEMVFDVTDYLEYASIDEYYDNFKTAYAEYDKYDGIDVEVKKGEKSITVIMNLDLKNIDEDTYSNLKIGNSDLGVSSKTFIKSFTDQKFTCK